MVGRYKDRQNGVGLLMSIILLLLITAVALGVTCMSNTENSINNNFKAEEMEYFAARAGVEEVRNRLLPNALDQANNAITLSAPTLPTAPPDAGGKVLYVLNGVTLAQVTTPPSAGNPNPYFDDELCHDIPGGAGGITQTPYNVPCTTTLPSTSITTTSSVAPYPLDYKWVRVMIKENHSTPYKVDNSQADNYPVCWDKSASPPAEIVTSLVTNCASGGSWQLARPVYMVTSLAVSPTGKTRRLVQEELSLGVQYNPPFSVYGTSTACPAITFSGNGSTGSFNSSTESTPQEPPTNLSTASGGDIGTNGGISLSGGASIAGMAGVASNPPCFITSGHPRPTSSTSIASETFPVTPAPNPHPPTTNTTYSQSTTMTPGNLYGNIQMSGQSTLTLQVPDGQGTVNNPAVFIMNSLSMTGQSSLVMQPADGAACGGSSTCYVQIILAGNGTNNPLSLSGGSLGNTSGIPATLTFNVAQPISCTGPPCGNVSLSGGSGAYAVVNAPLDNISVTGNGDVFGSVVGYQVTYSGNGTIWHDNAIDGSFTPDAYLHLISFRELSY
jgi:hypothetical protein